MQKTSRHLVTPVLLSNVVEGTGYVAGGKGGYGWSSVRTYVAIGFTAYCSDIVFEDFLPGLAGRLRTKWDS